MITSRATLFRSARLAALGAATSLLAAVCVLPASPADAAVRWDALDLSLATDSAGLEPVADCCYGGGAIAAEGNVVALAWTDTRADDPYGTRDSDVEVRRSNDGGQTWGQLQNVSHQDGLRAFGPVGIAVSPTSTVVSYGPSENASYSFTSFELVRVANDGTQTRTSLPGSNYFEHTLASDGVSSYYLARNSGFYGSQGISLLSSRDDGRTWETTVIAESVPEEQGALIAPQVAVDGDTVAVAWASPPTSGNSGAVRNEVWVATSTDAGQSFSAPTRITNTPQGESIPGIAVQSGVVAVGWNTRYSDVQTDFRVARSLDAGATWSTPVVAASDTSAMPVHSGYTSVPAPQLLAVPSGFMARTDRPASLPEAPLPGIFVSANGANWAAASGHQTPSRLGVMAHTGGRVVFGNGQQFIRAFDDVAAPQVAMTKTPPPVATDETQFLAAFTASDSDSHILTLKCAVNGRDLSYAFDGFCNAPSTPDRPSFLNQIFSAEMPVTFSSAEVNLARFSQEEARNKLEVIATDEAGNSTTQTYTWIYDTQKPSVRPGRLAPTTAATSVPWVVKATDRGAGIDFVTVRMRVGNGPWQVPAKWRSLPAKAKVLLPVKPGQKISVSAFATDKAGRVSRWSKTQSVTRAR